MSFSIDVNHDKQLLCVLGQGKITATDVEQYYSRLKATLGIELCDRALVNLAGKDVSLKGVPVKNMRSLGLLFHRAPVCLKMRKWRLWCVAR